MRVLTLALALALTLALTLSLSGRGLLVGGCCLSSLSPSLSPGASLSHPIHSRPPHILLSYPTAGLLEERNYVIARNIRKAAFQAKGQPVVAVLGMAHLNGVRELLRESRIV